ncbi:NfrA family protein [Robbsia andropogonis]|uniref:NfrA family protein n=1 Tax=Robbsia andropogonis TaxID=28092 RepID=UPI0020A1B876|nr:hypothetical protein [Robbsia andropogonis]MCP1118933.1 hypothetical protein [Robbsia andropogonis]MCP1128715.1 hypothetical protein [Robbsia andropogonis]
MTERRRTFSKRAADRIAPTSAQFTGCVPRATTRRNGITPLRLAMSSLMSVTSVLKTVSRVVPLLLGGAMPFAHADAVLPLPLSGPAYAVAQEAQRDYNARRYDESATQAREAIRQRPDVIDLRLLLANALAAGGHQREAIHVIDDARRDFGDQRVLLARRQQILIAGRPYTPTLAFLAAQEGYRAYARQDYPAAEAAASRSLDLDPRSMAVRLLLVDTLAAQHKDAEAYAAIQAALEMDASGGSDIADTSSAPFTAAARAGHDRADAAAISRADAERDLNDRRAVVGARLAIPDATAAALALKNGDDVQAVKHAKAAILFAPNDPTYRELLIAALFADRQPQAADTEATAAIALHGTTGASDSDPSGAIFYVWRAFARAQQNKPGEAIADAQSALQQLAVRDAPSLAPTDSDDNLALARRTRAINARLSIADLALYLGNAGVAEVALQPLHDALGQSDGEAHPTPTDINAVAVAQRWREAQALTAGKAPTLARLYPRIPATTSDTDAGGAAPLIVSSSALRAVTIPEPWSGTGAASTQTVARGRPAPPILECTLSTYGPACMTYPYDPAYAAYQAGARAFDRRDNTAAVLAAREAVRIAPDDATHVLLLIDALNADGRQSEARRVATNAVNQGLLDLVPDLQGAYLASAANRPKLAAQRFQRADANGDLPPTGYLDAGYATLQAGDAPVASSYFKRAIDADQAGTIALPPPTLLDTRRTESEIDRRGGLTVSTSYRPGVAAGLENNPSASTANKSLQTSVEGYWRPWGYMSGHTVEVYARASGTWWDDRSGFASASNSGARDAGVASLSGAVGVRGRPFATQNAVLAVEREIPLGRNAVSDWLARAAYSNGFGTAIRYDVPSWWTGTFYGEVGRYLQAGKNYWTTEADLGRTYRIDAIKPEATIFPYAVVGGDYNQLTNNGYGVGVGAGLTMRWQFRQDRYHAPRSYWQASVQYRFRIAGDDRAKGVFINLTYGY